ncbi:UNVERIFIED_ORG: hypothetical protein QE434_002426 [Rhizobium sp. SORGH_AS 755]|nr:hypothetical protein [Rhizobium sp. SORGH_AS_0755]
MILSYEERSPSIDPDAWVAEDATVCGDVAIGAGSRIMHGARLVAEAGGSICIGRNCIVFENAVIRATSRHGCSFGDRCIVALVQTAMWSAPKSTPKFLSQPEPPCFTGRKSDTGRKSASTEPCTCVRGWKRARPCRSDGWLSETPRKLCRRISTKPCGKFRRHWIFRVLFIASIEVGRM